MILYYPFYFLFLYYFGVFLPLCDSGSSDPEIQRFSGNLSHSDDFKLILRDGDFLIIGAKNLIYNISLTSFETVRRLEWYPSEQDLDSCVLKGINKEKRCQNYIRVLALKSDGGLFVCGTHAYRPKCRDYVQTANGYEYRNETPGDALCPFGPDQNNTAIFAGNIKTSKHLK